MIRSTVAATLLTLTAGFVACAPGFAPAPKIDSHGATFTVDKRDDSETEQIYYEEPKVLLPSHLSPPVVKQPDTPPVSGNDPQSRGAPPATGATPAPIIITWPDDDDSPPDIDRPTPSATPTGGAPVAPPHVQPAVPESSATPAPPAAPPAPVTTAPSDARPMPTPASDPVATPAPVEPAPAPAQPPSPIAPPRSAHAWVACEKMDPAFCPEAVGLLIIRTPTWMGQCTASLIGDQIAITNSHCIPDELKIDGGDCAANLAIYFPQTTTAAPEKVQCDKILKVSRIAKEGDKKFALEADFAVLHLARKVNRKIFQLKRDGLSDGLKLAAYTIDPVSNGHILGIIKAKFCNARQRSVSAPSFVQDFAPVGSFDGCEIIPGNSGSAAIDRDGFVRALVHATLPSQVMPQPKGAPGDAPARLYHRMAMLTNIACTTIPAEVGTGAGEPNPACAKSLTPDDVVRAAYAAADDKKIEPLAQEWLKTAPRQFEFDVRPSSSQGSSMRLLAPQIKCVKDPKSWLPPGSTAVTLKVTLPFFGFVLDLDEDYRVRLTPGAVDEMEATFVFDPAALMSAGSVTSRATIRSRNTQQAKEQAYSLVRCR